MRMGGGAEDELGWVGPVDAGVNAIEMKVNE